MSVAAGSELPSLDALLSRRLIPVLGKGGVGKSTVATSLALAAMRRGRRVLVAEAQGGGTTGPLLGAEAPGENPVQVREDAESGGAIYNVNITSESAMREFVLLVVRYRFIYETFFENRLVRSFLRFVPSLAELVLLGKLWYHEGELEGGRNPRFRSLMRGDPVARQGFSPDPSAGDRPRFDLLILDLPSTGHGIALLRAPAVVAEASPPGQMRWICQAIQALLEDAERTALVLCTLAEELPVTEAIEARATLRDVAKVPAALCVVNSVLSPLLPGAGDAALFEELSGLGPESLPPEDVKLLDAMLDTAGHYRRRETRQQAQLARLHSELDLPLVRLPRLWRPQHGAEEIELLSRALEGGLAPAEVRGETA